MSDRRELPADLLGGHLRRCARPPPPACRRPGRLDDYRAAGARAAELGLSLRTLVDAALAVADALTGPSVLPPCASRLRPDGGLRPELSSAAIRGADVERREFVDDLLQGRAEASPNGPSTSASACRVLRRRAPPAACGTSTPIGSNAT